MTDTLNQNYLLENVLFNRVMLVDIIASAPNLNLSFIGKNIKREYQHIQVINETFETVPTVERFYPIKFECQITNTSEFEQSFEFKIRLYQGATTCGQILRKGILKPFQTIKLNQPIYFPFV